MKYLFVSCLFFAGCSCSTTEAIEYYRSDSTYTRMIPLEIFVPPIKAELPLQPIDNVGYTFTNEDSSVSGIVDTTNKKVTVRVNPKPVDTTVTSTDRTVKESRSELKVERLAWYEKLWNGLPYLLIGAVIGFGLFFILIIPFRRAIQ